MITKISILMCVMLMSIAGVNAQWTRVGKFDKPVNDMMVYYNQLYLAGDFTQYNDSACYTACHYSGTTMTKIIDPLTGGGVRRLNIFQNSLYGTNALNFGTQSGLATYSLDNWSPETGFSTAQTGIYSNADYIFVGSDAGGLVSRVRGTTSYIPTLQSGNGAITSILEYGNNLIIAGSFTSIASTNCNHIAAMTGAVVQSTFTTGLDDNVSRLIVYKGNLYACGTFLKAGGNTAKYIAKWNGASWSQVGGGLTSTGTKGVLDMMVYNNSLFVVGEFTKAGNVNALNVAKWNDTTWTSMNYSMPGYVTAIKVLNSSFYISSYTGDSAILYKAPITTGIDEQEMKTISAHIYPNPAHNELHINIENEPGGMLTYVLMSMEGKVIMSDVFNTETTINTNGLKFGIYLMRLSGDHVADLVKKIIVE